MNLVQRTTRNSLSLFRKTTQAEIQFRTKPGLLFREFRELNILKFSQLGLLAVTCTAKNCFNVSAPSAIKVFALPEQPRQQICSLVDLCSAQHPMLSSNFSANKRDEIIERDCVSSKQPVKLALFALHKVCRKRLNFPVSQGKVPVIENKKTSFASGTEPAEIPA